MALDFDEVKDDFKEFLNTFYSDDVSFNGGKDYKYCRQLTDVANREALTIVIDLDDVQQFFNKDELIMNIERNTKRYTEIMSQAISEILPDHKTHDSAPKNALDVYLEHRLEIIRQREAELNNLPPPDPALDETNPALTATNFPPELLRRFEVYWNPRKATKVQKIRELLAGQIGRLVTIHGNVIRASEVSPLLSVGTYVCDMCSAETFQVVHGPVFMPVNKCESDFCKKNKTGGRLTLQTRGSKLLKFQELRIQELSSEVPPGNVPRQISVHCRGENTRIAAPGDHVSISGIFLPLAKSTAFQQMSAGLLTDTYLDAHRINLVSKWDDAEFGGELSEEELEEMMEGDERMDFYNRLAASIAPEVYGHEDVKKSLLLMLVGGVERNVGGLKIRGTINICLMGDPGVAKSQLLSYVDRLAPRSQMTSGRGSSGVGLTASVMKDSVTGLMTLEAGALMLADEGVCCIDEFDKMDETDRTALHEVMEQQTISIAKAGILTTLHARTSILAAANPAWSRYNPNRSISENINLPAALLSRFDILWLLHDKHDQQEDLRLAKHITYVHEHGKEPETSNLKVFDIKLLRRYIVTCRKRNPTIPETLSERLVQAYVELRKDSRDGHNDTFANKNKIFTSPRSLLAILRLSTALARLRLQDEVSEDDVAEAIRLVERARDSTNPTVASGIGRARPVARIYELIRKMKQCLPNEEKTLLVKDIRGKASNLGFTSEQLDSCLELYETRDVWHLNTNRTKLTFIT